jgi:predicted component of type VI protein secretion system
MFQGGKYVIEDLGSTNGTFVNGQRLAGPAVLKPGDVVSLGEQIVLMYDAISVDAGATVAVSRKAAQASPPPIYTAPQPVYAPAPQQAYAPPPAAKKSNAMPIIIAVGALLFICACAGFFWWVDATYRWCILFPFISGC